MNGKTKRNWAFFIAFAMYFTFYFLAGRWFVLPYYYIMALIALSTLGEKIWRKFNSVRPLRLRQEMERLHPLINEVYMAAYQYKPDINRSIKLYIQEDMSINAFAFGKRTIVLTRGIIQMMDDECLKGIIAHEFGHNCNGDTVAELFIAITNLSLSATVLFWGKIKKKFDAQKQSLFLFIFKIIYDLNYYSCKSLQGLFELILIPARRSSEYEADKFALNIGYGAELNRALLELYGITFSKPEGLKEQLRATHPHITKRIERLEKFV